MKLRKVFVAASLSFHNFSRHQLNNQKKTCLVASTLSLQNACINQQLFSYGFTFEVLFQHSPIPIVALLEIISLVSHMAAVLTSSKDLSEGNLNEEDFFNTIIWQRHELSFGTYLQQRMLYEFNLCVQFCHLFSLIKLFIFYIQVHF